MTGQTASLPATVPTPLLHGPQLTRLQDAVAGLDALQLQWVSGYAAGLAAANSRPVAAADPGHSLTILYGSQTGNGEVVARNLAESARNAGFAVRLQSLADYKPSQLKRESLLSLIVSTHGEGDPPDDAELFHEYLFSAKAPPLGGLKFSVLALGDSSYASFCETGRELDQRLAELGAGRLSPLVECDLDYEAAAALWAEDIVDKLPDLLQAVNSLPHLRAVDNAVQFDKSNPFVAEVLANQKITGGGSDKDVRHIELSLEGSGLVYEPGDALAVVVRNPPKLVENIVSALALDATEIVTVDDVQLPFADALREKREITQLNTGFLRAWAEIAGAAELDILANGGHTDALSSYIESRQVIDVLREFPAATPAQSFCDALRTLSPRSYSIASSQSANPDEVHLTVAAVRYEAFGTDHWGAGSTHISERVGEGDALQVFVEPNTRFRLPDDDSTPVIMIGPGTGVAPFRAFVEERTERGASGPNWLFFGDRTFSNDFLYQLEWQRHLKQGHLARLDVAFSRDQDKKVYVQDRLREQAADIHAWLQDGAHLYICGDAKRMAGDVHEALVDIFAEQGSVDRIVAERQLKELRRAGRYQRDVY